MKFTDLFIRRPVLASVVSLFILALGLRSFSALQVLEYPKTENGVVTITTSFPGADPESIAGYITTPIETAVAQANGIDYMTSISQNSTSTITVNLRQNYDTSKAAAEINIKVNSVLNQLPTGSLLPAITIQIGQSIDAMYMGFTSDTLAANQITDYLTRVVQPKLRAVEGVQTAEILGGQTRQFVHESGGVMATFGFAIIIAFLTLAALYESFRDPLVILISVPLSIAGALIFIAIGVGGATLNIYTQVGLVTLIGLISKHGILIVEVANEEQQSGKSKRAAIVRAASVRLRPILMTTAAMVLGVIPLVLARGAGAESRYAIGLVISSGLGIGTLFTLFVVPAVYMLIGATHSPERARLPPSNSGNYLLHSINYDTYLTLLRYLANFRLSKLPAGSSKPIRARSTTPRSAYLKTLTKSALRFVECLVYSNCSVLI